MDRTDDLLSQVLERPATEWSAALDDLCAAYAAMAPELRRRFEILRRLGVAAAANSDCSPAEEPFPEQFGPYRLVRRLGGGGMGVVYLALHEQLGRNVALKLIRPERLYFEDARARFRREIEAVARLDHPGCVQIHQVGETQGVPYFAMEYVDGSSFEVLVHRLAGRAPNPLGVGEGTQDTGCEQPSRQSVPRSRASRLSGRDLVEVMRTTASRSVESSASEVFSGPWVRVCLRLVLASAEAMTHAHARGVIHRDLKPSNLMLTPEGNVVVIDFGLAVADGISRMTRSGVVLGSLPYMAPEQVRGESHAIDARTDVYALGVCLYELLTLVSPFDTGSAQATREKILLGQVQPLRSLNQSVGIDVAVICGRAMQPDPRRRYQAMAEFAADLAAVLEHRAIVARPASPWQHAVRWARRHPALATGTLLCSLALLLGPLIVSFAVAGQRDRAVAAKTLAQRREYAANVAAANAALLAGNGPEARLRLDACAPEMRGFEWRHLDLALRGALMTVEAHAAPTVAVAVSSDRRWLASGADSGEVAVFDASDGRRMHTLPGRAGVVQLEFDRTSTSLYVVDRDGRLRVFDVAGGGLLRVREPAAGYESVGVARGAVAVVCDHGGGHFERLDPTTLQSTGRVSLAGNAEWPRGFFLSDGKHLCAGVSTGGFALWDLDSGALVTRVSHARALVCMATSPNMARVVGSDTRSMVWWDGETGALSTLDTGGREVVDVAITPDGHHVAAGCAGGEILVYDLADGRLLCQLYGHRGAVRAIVAGPERDVLVTGGADGTLRLFSALVSPEVLGLRGLGDGDSLAVSSAGVLFAGSRDAAARRIDVGSGDAVWTTAQPHWVNSLALVLDDAVLVASYHTRLRFLDSETGAPRGEILLPDAAGYAYSMLAEPGGHRLWVCDQNGNVARVDVAAREVRQFRKVHAGVARGVVFDRATSTLVSVGDDGRIVELDADTLAERRQVAATGAPVLAILADTDALVTSERGALCRRSRRDGTIIDRAACARYVLAMQWLDTTRLVTGSVDGRIVLHERQTLEPIVELRQPLLQISAIVVDPHGGWLATQGAGGDPRVVFAVRDTACDGGLASRRLLVASARDLMTRTMDVTGWSPIAREVIDGRADLSHDLRAAAAKVLPYAGPWWPASFARLYAQSPEVAPARQQRLGELQRALQQSLRHMTEEQAPLVRTALGLTALRLGDPAAALAAIEPLAAAIQRDVRAGAPVAQFVRAMACRQLGRLAEADAARAELHALAAGDLARDPETLAYVREVDDLWQR